MFEKFTDKARKVMSLAQDEARNLGQMYVGTEHLLLGIVAEGNGRAMDALRQMGVSGDAVRNAVNELAGKSSESAQQPATADVRMAGFGGPGPQQQGDEGSVLEQYGRNLTKLAADGKLDPVIGRDREIERVMQVLARRQKNNPLILGDPGVGKTAIVEGLAQLIASGNVPDILRGKQVWTLDLASLVAGSKYRGEFEERMKKVVRELEESDEDILFIHRRGLHSEAAPLAW